MKAKTLFYTGIILVCGSLYGMLSYHEYSLCEPLFLIGIVLVGVGSCFYLGPIPDIEPVDTPEINTDQINKNIQTLNNILWGKKEKPEPSIVIICPTCGTEMKNAGKLSFKGNQITNKTVKTVTVYHCDRCGYRTII